MRKILAALALSLFVPLAAAQTFNAQTLKFTQGMSVQDIQAAIKGAKTPAQFAAIARAARAAGIDPAVITAAMIGSFSNTPGVVSSLINAGYPPAAVITSAVEAGAPSGAVAAGARQAGVPQSTIESAVASAGTGSGATTGTTGTTSGSGSGSSGGGGGTTGTAI